MKSDWSSGLDLLVDLDRSGGLRDSIERTLREAIRAGRLAVGTMLPSSRSLARDLGVARGTVTAAYGQLAAEGYLEQRQGALTRVSWAPPARRPPAANPEPPNRPRWDFRPGRPDSASFPRASWARVQRHVIAHAPDDRFGYGDPRGSPELRLALADYLGRARAVDTDPGRLLICGGFTQALALICLTLRRAGRRGTPATLAVEDPSAPRYRQLAEAMGLSVAAIACDEDGVRVDRLSGASARAVLVTPAHQYPLGITMSAGRRTALVQWARRHQALIIEDDYDGEFRYDRQPVGALQRLDPEHVIYVGSTSKTLAPGLRLGWLSAPAAMAGALAAAKDHLDRGTSILDQLALAEFIRSGAFDQHIRRMRTSYRRRRDELARAIAAHPSDLRLAGIAAGLHAVLYLPWPATPGRKAGTAERLRSSAARNSVALEMLASYWRHPPEPSPPAIVLGFGTPASHAYRPALQALLRLL